ncbi:discoidin domain-containing protein [Streptomyces collinus]|uniref:discoidin domain-containing protein n=1 Tax=Streptomyces collinus TaxID=42684 RepID=UPI003822BBA4
MVPARPRSTQTFDQLVLDTTASSGDFVRQWMVYTSNDGTTWGKPVATGPGSTVTRIQLPTTARYIRVVNKASSGSWWSISDVSVYAPGGKITAATSSNHRPSAQEHDPA